MHNVLFQLGGAKTVTAYCTVGIRREMFPVIQVTLVGRPAIRLEPMGFLSFGISSD